MKKLLLILMVLFGFMVQSFATSAPPDVIFLLDRDNIPKTMVDNRYHIMIFQPMANEVCIVSLECKPLALNSENTPLFIKDYGGEFMCSDTRHGVVLVSFINPEYAQAFFNMLCYNFLEYDPYTKTLKRWYSM
jgi:hypothetical protein